ncbi:MAG: hypothetical protein ACREQF_01415, partial [Candidatus Binataceae bacterium]
MTGSAPESADIAGTGPVAAATATPSQNSRLRIASEILALAYISTIAAVANFTGAFYILFPELGALAYDVLTRPRGRWCNSPIHLATTPALTGVIGIAVTRMMPYGLPSIFATIAGALVVMVGFGSPIAPSISAGLLPLTVDVQSWWYPAGVLFGTVLLTALSVVWKPFLLNRRYREIPIDEGSPTDSVRAHPSARYWT